MDPLNFKRGRPFGGLAWVIDREFKKLDFEFFSRYCSFIHVKKGEVELAFIGLYLPFDNPQNRIDSLNNFETTLTIVKSIIERFSYNDIPVMTLGDFNSDIFRKKRFDKILLNFILDNNLLNLSQLSTQKINCTYPNELLPCSDIKYNIDHVLINLKGIDKFLSIQCNLLDDLANMSDHKALVTTLELKSNLDFSPISTIYDSNIDFMKPDLKLRYNSSLNINLDKLMLELNDLNQSMHNFNDILYEKISSAILDAETDTLTLQKQLYPT
jgi:hypothetical protein